MVTARICSSASAARNPYWPTSRRYSQLRSERADAAATGESLRSAPAQKARPLELTITTSSSRWLSNQRAASANSCSIVAPTALSRSGRLSVSRPRASSTLTLIVWNSRVSFMMLHPGAREALQYSSAVRKSCVLHRLETQCVRFEKHERAPGQWTFWQVIRDGIRILPDKSATSAEEVMTTAIVCTALLGFLL